MSPTKWITMKHTQAPRRAYQFGGSGVKTYTQEDIFFKLWLPILHQRRYSVMLGPQFRTEQMEFLSQGENPIHELSNWNLRSMGVDLRACIQVDSNAWLMLNGNANQTGNLHDQPQANIPINYTISGAYLRKVSPNKEIGFGLILNRSFHATTPLPILIYHYNYSSRAGIEISLPYKITWRHNLSPADILYLKTEGSTRNYYIERPAATASMFRRTDLDIGVAYNRRINKLVGVEVFGGYRRNLSSQIPADVQVVKGSGTVFSVELYIKPPIRK